MAGVTTTGIEKFMLKNTGNESQSPKRKKGNDGLPVDADGLPIVPDNAKEIEAMEVPQAVHPWVADMLKAILISSTTTTNNQKTTNNKVSDLERTVKTNTTTVDFLVKKCTSLEGTCKVLTGRIIQAENQIEMANDTINDLMARSMRNNVMIRSTGDAYKEIRNENTALIFRNFLRDEMGVANAHDIHIERAHRMGKASQGFNKTMIAKIPNQCDLNRIFDKVQTLKGTSNSINIQMPPDYSERKQHGWSDFKEAKKNRRQASFRPNGQLLIDNRVVKHLEPSPIPPLANEELGALSEEFLSGESSIIDTNNHSFRARIVKVDTTQDIRDAMDILSADAPLAKQIPFAFRIRTLNDRLIEDFNSKRDAGVGPLILKHLRRNKLENIVCFVPHSYSERYIDGSIKFKVIEECINQAIAALQVNADTAGWPEGSDKNE